MFKKLLISIISVFTLNAAMPNFSMPNVNSFNQQTNQNDLPKTMQEAKQQEEQLKKLAQINPKNYFMLGIFYITEIPLKDGKIKPANFEAAKKAFEISSQAGITLSDYFLAIIEYKNKQYGKALNILENDLSYKLKNPHNKEYNIMSAYYASIVLDFYPENEILLQKAINYIYPVAQDTKLASAQYLLANLYLYEARLKKSKELMNKADYWLTQTCINPTAPIKIKQICNQFKGK